MTDTDEPIFEEPWQAKAFAIVLMLHERGLYTWSEWTDLLSARIVTAEAAGDVDKGYYHHWLGALEDMLVAKEVIVASEAERWREAWRHAAIRTPHGVPIEVRSEDF
jgi:nitrile hydratase accessory protein